MLGLFVIGVFLFFIVGNDGHPNSGHRLLASDEELKTEMNNRLKASLDNKWQTLVIYHVGMLSSHSSMSLAIINLKLLSSVVKSTKSVFYIFNVIGGASNPLFAEAPCNLSHMVACADFLSDTYPLEMVNHLQSHKRILESLNAGSTTFVSDTFKHVLFLSQDARGPLVDRMNGKWLEQFSNLLDKIPTQISGRGQVVAVAASMSCVDAGDDDGKQKQRNQPRVHSHAWMVHAQLADEVFAVLPDLSSQNDRKVSILDPRFVTEEFTRIKHMEELITNSIRDKGYHVAALANGLQQRQQSGASKAYISTSECRKESGNLRTPTSNPLEWCNLRPEKYVFFKTGAELFQTPGVVCQSTIDLMGETIVAINSEEPGLQLALPETLYSGPYTDLYRQYSLEQQHVHVPPAAELQRHNKPSNDDNKQRNNYVCFLVRTASVHGHNKRSKLAKMEISLLVQTLQRQTNPTWKAFFFITDDKPFKSELLQILKRYQDMRLQYLYLKKEHSVKFTKEDAGYTATDAALHQIMSQHKECRWVSVTNADNAYGSAVVQQVIAATLPPERRDAPEIVAPDMVLLPVDSRNFAEQDYLMRPLIRSKPEKDWGERCVGIETSLKTHTFAYTIQTVPVVGRADLAAVFFNRAKLADENVKFGNFTDPDKYSCLGCQDGYLTEYLVRTRQWTYKQIPLDGLRSIVFHGPSPTLCIASGNVWFDYPHVDKVGCLSHYTIGHYLHRNKNYDFGRFYHPSSPRVCIRLSSYGYHDNQTQAAIT